MTLREVTTDAIVEIADELRDVLNDPYDSEIIMAVEECIGRRVTETEARLILSTYNTDAETAKKTVWYDLCT